jgi:hypothetical protein
MKSEADPITDDEWLLRRIHKDRFKTNRVPIISPSAFEPRVKGRDPDVDGISLYREACLASPDEILATVAEEKRHEYAIVRVPVSALQELELSVDLKPDERVKGHVIIPELNATDYAATKSVFTPTLLDLARLASQDENIVRTPHAL